jgi:hypothetical protein
MIEEMGSLTNLGDLFIITFYLAVATGIITAFTLFRRSYRQRKEQLDRIEARLNDLPEK